MACNFTGIAVVSRHYGKGWLEFVGFEDETGIFETVFFPAAYRDYGETLEEERPYIIRGRVEDDMGAVYINVRELRAVE